MVRKHRHNWKYDQERFRYDCDGSHNFASCSCGAQRETTTTSCAGNSYIHHRILSAAGETIVNYDSLGQGTMSVRHFRRTQT